MSVTVHFACSGCNATAEGTKPLRWEFVSFSGRSYGFGSQRQTVNVSDVIPKGWIAADPYTYVTYCPKCWTEIEAAPDPEPTSS